VNDAQRLSLRAATASPDVALAAWRDLVDRYDLADLWDAEVYRLLPLVWWRFGDEVGTEHVDRLRGVYRKAWVTNQHLRQRGGEAVAALAAEGIECLVLNGAALGPLIYGDPAARPMRNVDLLVRRDDAVAAWRLLEGLGYRARVAPVPLRSSWRRDPGDDWYLRRCHPRAFDRGTLDVVDVHTTLTPELVTADPESDDLWARAGDVDLGELTAATLSVTDHLGHALVRGWDGPGPDIGLRRVVDVVALVAQDDIDWSLLVATAARHHATLLLAGRLDDLCRSWGAAVPTEVVAELGAARPDRRERVAASLRTRRRGAAAAAFVTTTRGLDPWAAVRRAPGFLADRWQLRHRRHVPLAAAQHLRRRLRR
jgi:hypothetical protein